MGHAGNASWAAGCALAEADSPFRLRGHMREHNGSFYCNTGSKTHTKQGWRLSPHWRSWWAVALHNAAAVGGVQAAIHGV
jgi:hypothetical protein